MIKITNLAFKYIYNLCKIKKKKYLRININFNNINTDFEIYFCDINKINKNDIKINYDKFIIYIETNSFKYLYNSEIDIIEKNFNKKLVLNTKNNIFKKIRKNCSLINKIKFIIYRDINPILFKHGGKIDALKIINNSCLIVKFYGGCNGCFFSNKTLEEIIKKKIVYFFPQINEIKDITNHKHDNYSYI